MFERAGCLLCEKHVKKLGAYALMKLVVRHGIGQRQ